LDASPPGFFRVSPRDLPLTLRAADLAHLFACRRDGTFLRIRSGRDWIKIKYRKLPAMERVADLLR